MDGHAPPTVWHTYQGGGKADLVQDEGSSVGGGGLLGKEVGELLAGQPGGLAHGGKQLLLRHASGGITQPHRGGGGGAQIRSRRNDSVGMQVGIQECTMMSWAGGRDQKKVQKKSS